MKRKLLLVICVLGLCSSFCFGKNLISKSENVADKENDGFNLISGFNLQFLQFGIKRPGWGLKYEFEKYLANHMAVTGEIGHSSFFGSWFDFSDFVTTATAGVNFRAYPMYNSLRGPYVGFGAGADYMFYFGDRELHDDIQKAFFYVKPEVGWKFYILKHFMIDVLVDYKFQVIMDRDSLPDFYESYLDNGLHFSLAFKFFWAK